jgi:outer membrane protein
MTNRTLLALLVAAGLAGAAGPAPAATTAPAPARGGPEADGQKLTLAEARRIALARHPLLKGAAADVAAAEQAVRIANAAALPQIGAAAVLAFTDGPNSRIAATGGLNDPTVLGRGSAGLGLSQLITDFGRTASLTSAAEGDVQAERARETMTREAVLFQVTEAFYEALHAADLKQVAETTQRQRQLLLDRITSLAHAKLRSGLDVAIAEQDLGEAKQLLLDATTRGVDALATLSQVLGYSGAIPLTPDSRGLPDPSPVVLDGALDAALQNKHELRALDAQRTAASRRAEAAHDAYYPQLSALGYAGLSPWHRADQRLDHHYAAGGLSLTIPLYSGGALTARARQADAQASAAGWRLEDRRNQLLRDVRIVYNGAQAAYANISVTRSLLDNADKTLSLVQARYDIGSSSIVELSEAQLRRTQAAIAHADARYAYLVKRAALDYITGSLDRE